MHSFNKTILDSFFTIIKEEKEERIVISLPINKAFEIRSLGLFLNIAATRMCWE